MPVVRNQTQRLRVHLLPQVRDIVNVVGREGLVPVERQRPIVPIVGVEIRANGGFAQRLRECELRSELQPMAYAPVDLRLEGVVVRAVLRHGQPDGGEAFIEAEEVVRQRGACGCVYVGWVEMRIQRDRIYGSRRIQVPVPGAHVGRLDRERLDALLNAQAPAHLRGYVDFAELAGDAQRRKRALGLRHRGDVVIVIRRRKVGRRIDAHIQVIAAVFPAVAHPEPAANSRFAGPKHVQGEPDSGPQGQ